MLCLINNLVQFWNFALLYEVYNEDCYSFFRLAFLCVFVCCCLFCFFCNEDVFYLIFGVEVALCVVWLMSWLDRCDEFFGVLTPETFVINDVEASSSPSDSSEEKLLSAKESSNSNTDGE